MPIYNGIEFIKESINSIKNQTYQDWELLVGVNGCGLNSKNFRRAKKFENDKIKVYEFNFGGKSKTLNELIKLAQGDWIALLDVDDKWHPKKLEKQVLFIDKYDVIGTDTRYFGEKKDKPNLPMKDLGDFNFLNYNPITNSSVLLKKELCWWEKDGLEDYELWLRLWKRKCKFYNVKKELTYHRVHQKSFFNTNKDLEKELVKLKEYYSKNF